MQTNNPRKQELEQIARKVRVLRAFSKETGFHTTRSVGTLLASLTPDELYEVAELSEISPVT
jgi:hypothetical protein